MLIRIFFDNIIFSWQKAGGISVVWYELLKRIISEKSLLCSFIEYQGATSNIFRKNLVLKQNIILKKNILFCLQRYFNPKINCNEKFIFHSSYYRTSPNKNAINITTVHDFTYEYFSKGLKQKIHSYQKKKAIKNSDYIIAISENTKKDILKFIPEIDERKIRVIYNGISEDYHIINTTPTLSNHPFYTHDYILFVGARDSYKNFDIVIKTLSLSMINLVLVGGELTKKEIQLLNSRLGPNRYKSLGRVSNKELNILYNHAFCLLYPSSYEGFGIPVIEAQRAGCPVIAYNSSSIPEIIGDTTLLINNLSTSEILQCFQTLREPLIRKDIIQKGLKNAERFSWDTMYQQTLNLYQEASSLKK